MSEPELFNRKLLEYQISRLTDEERHKLKVLVDRLTLRAEIRYILTDVRTGALPVSDWLGFMIFMLRKIWRRTIRGQYDNTDD